MLISVLTMKSLRQQHEAVAQVFFADYFVFAQLFARTREKDFTIEQQGRHGR